MLKGPLAIQGYDWWWHSFTGRREDNGQERSFFIDYFTCNPAFGTTVPILGQLPENKRQKIAPSYLMVKAGCWGQEHMQLNRFFGWKDVSINENAPFSLRADDCFVSDEVLQGSVKLTQDEVNNHPEYMSDSGTMEWNLKAYKKIAYNVGFGAGKAFRDADAFEMYWHVEGMKTEYEGTVIVNGVKYIVERDNSYGYSDKNWGSDFTSPWIWLSSNDLVSNLSGKRLCNSVFDIGGGRPVAFGMALNRKLLGEFNYEGKSYEFNFSKFWTGSKTEFDCYESEDKIVWHVKQQTRKALLDTQIECPKSEMLLINYEAPDGSKKHNRLWNGGNGSGILKLYRKSGKKLLLIDEVKACHTGCEYGEYSADN